MQECTVLLPVETPPTPTVDEEAGPEEAAEESTPPCVHCGELMELVQSSFKPSWREVMFSKYRPSWYGDG
ncbi:hypothetical protein K227x_23200 [Rubripirellula lacrimiformis]|uniref:Uncharacterized protein n=1 Tax=Rubripirellula lacrimiformis TaxID=1930273 RepID=A0A517N9X2_9BACT|nr:hypothetical protein K227x_23200 [Rubripirellula lacrimiformis]